MSFKLELEVLRILAEAQAKGSEWVSDRIAELERSREDGEQGSLFHFRARAIPPRPEYLANAQTLGDAVVAAVKHIGRFTNSRAILDAVRDYPVIFLEPDERQKRRKVSQALYVQRASALVSTKIDKRTYWGLPEWLTDSATIAMEYFPETDLGSGGDDDESDY